MSRPPLQLTVSGVIELFKAAAVGRVYNRLRRPSPALSAPCRVRGPPEVYLVCPLLCVRRQRLSSKLGAKELVPSHLLLPCPAIARMSSVRRTYLLPMVLVITIAIGLRKVLQTGNESKITDWVPPHDKTGEFKRGQSAFRNFISREPGAQFPPEKDRYHLYVSYACPWGMLANLYTRQD